MWAAGGSCVRCGQDGVGGGWERAAFAMLVTLSDRDSRVSGARKSDLVWVAGLGKRHFE